MFDDDPTNRPRDPQSLTRRRFLGATLGLGVSATLAGPITTARAAEPAPGLPSAKVLEKSPFAYISPLKSNGKESACHAELWYAWIDEAVVVTVATDRWKATAVAKGLDQARIWIGDHGLWRTWYGGTNDDFRAAKNFVARGERVRDPELLERLLAIYETKYPEEIAQWRGPMRTGNADGSRIILRYTPAQ